MRLTKIIERRIRRRRDGVDLATDVHAAIAANVGERGSSAHVSSSQRIVQRSGKHEVSNETANEK